MRRSGFYLGSIRGTTITIEVSFLVLVGLFVLLDMESRVPIERALLWIPVLFLGVLLHELGHAGAIGMFGYGPSRITLAGFGGFTENQRTSKAWHDVVISVAGPLMSFLLAFVAFVTPRFFPTSTRDPFFVALVPMLIQANLVWGIFNLVPVFPLDGGQAFLSFLRLFLRPMLALRISVWCSLAISGALLVFALVHRWFFLVIIAGMLLMQNFERYRVLRRPPEDPGPPQ